MKKRPVRDPDGRGRYAELRKMLTVLGEARHRWKRSEGVAGAPAVARNREAFDALRERTLEDARRVLAPDP